MSVPDTVRVSISQNPEPVIVDEKYTFEGNPLQWNDTFHLSRAYNVSFVGLTIPGGNEDCIDVQYNSTLVSVSDCRLHPNGLFGMTIKGGSGLVHLKNVVFETHGKETDIDLGNWSDQNQKDKTKLVTIENVTSADGQPVKVRVLWADKPTVIGGNVKVIVYPKIFVVIYRWLRARNWVK